jgi:hypothetical protein
MRTIHRLLLVSFACGAVSVGGVAFARSRDFDGVEEPHVPAAPRSGPIFVAAGLGIDSLVARWPDHNFLMDGRAQQSGPELRFEVGWVIDGRNAVFLESTGSMPVVPYVGGLFLGQLGVGGDHFFGDGEAWHLRASVRRGWAHISSGLAQAGIKLEPPPRNELNDIWLFEVGVGTGGREGHVDSSGMLLASGGPVIVDGQAGWTAGVSLALTWSRS